MKIAEEFNTHFSGIADRLRDLLPNLTFDVSRLLDFVKYKKDPAVSFSVPDITDEQVQTILKKISTKYGVDKISARLFDGTMQ